MKFSILRRELIKLNIEKINSLFNEVFGSNREVSELSWRIIDNPLGESLILICEDNSRIVMARVFWNLGYKHYQCIDTVVHPDYQGLGLFRKSHDFVLKTIPDISFYNLPNSMSYPVYKRLGWQDLPVTYIKFFIVPFGLNHIPEIKWSLDALEWRYGNCPGREYFYCKYKNVNILFFYKKRFFPVVLGFTRCNIEFLRRRPLTFGFSYDENVRGLPYLLRKSKRVHYNTGDNLNSAYYNFDMF